MRRLTHLGGLIVLAVALWHVPTASADWNPQIDPADFQDEVGGPLPIDNIFLPMAPGTTCTYVNETDEGTEVIEVYVTHDTTTVMGVECLVVYDVATLDGEMIEQTWDWYAQDVWGNVWYFGEYSEQYEGGVLVSTEGSWEAGEGGALPGIVMLARPRPGDRYRQEYYEGEAEDAARVMWRNVSILVPYGYFRRCLVTLEWTPLEPGHFEFKCYAPFVGQVLAVGWDRGEWEDREREELVDITFD